MSPVESYFPFFPSDIVTLASDKEAFFKLIQRCFSLLIFADVGLRNLPTLLDTLLKVRVAAAETGATADTLGG